jgi:hypothetical protein
VTSAFSAVWIFINRRERKANYAEPAEQFHYSVRKDFAGLEVAAFKVCTLTVIIAMRIDINAATAKTDQ